MRSVGDQHVDGFGRELLNDADGFVELEDQNWSGLHWGKYRESQNVFYLHGALHFFDKGIAVEKEKYDVYNYLLDKIRARMEKGEYPIFVAAGDSLQKLSHIRHNQYLTYCYDSFCKIGGSLVTYGFGFGFYDEHILAAINRAARQKSEGKLLSVYIGVYSEEDLKRIEQIEQKIKCKVHIYDAKTVDLWGWN